MGDGCGEVAPDSGVPEVAGVTNILDDRPWIEKEVPAKPQVRIGTYSVRRWVAIVAVVAVVVGGPLGVSYIRALTVPGGGALGARTVDWVRSMGGSRLVAWFENMYYGHNAPPAGGAPAGAINGSPSVDPRSVDPQAPDIPLSPLGRPANVPAIAEPPLPSEGQWEPLGRTVGGATAMYAAFIRPDPIHTSLTAGLVWMDPRVIDLRLVAGSQQPGGIGWADQAPLPADERRRLLATFNAGFRLADGWGGYYEAGRTGRPLVDGAASLVIDRDGSATVAKWGRDVTMTASVSAVRQNLSLILDGGLVTPEVFHNSMRSWGATLRNEVLVWRSGIGVTPNGALVYAAGPGLSIESLAEILKHAGAVRAMELDINSTWVSFVSFKPAMGAGPSVANGSKLLPMMSGDAGRYLGASTRDFFAVLARPGAPVTDVGPSVLSPTPSLNPLLTRTPVPPTPPGGGRNSQSPGQGSNLDKLGM
jgi:hypothetical protein